MDDLKTIDYENMYCVGEIISNFDHVIEYENVKELIKGNCYGEYPAWDFWGAIWYEEEKYYCMIKQFHCHVGTIEANTLEDLMEECSNKYGWD